MARSNSYNFSLNRDELIRRAFQTASVYSLTETIPAEENDFAIVILNSMLKKWGADPKLWKRKQATLFTTYGDKDYSLSISGDHCTNSYVTTTLDSDAAAGTTSLSVVSNAGMTIGDNIGIKLDDDSRFWTTIATLPGSSGITITDALSDDTSVDKTIVTYTSKINRPLRVIQANKFNLITNNESKIKLISHDQYFGIPTKTTAGDPNNAYYDKQLDSGVFNVWPVPNNVDVVIKLTYLDSIMDMDSATDDFDFPQEWTEPALLNLACSLALHFGKEDKYQSLKPEAMASYEQLKNFDSDMESTVIRIRRRR